MFIFWTNRPRSLTQNEWNQTHTRVMEHYKSDMSNDYVCGSLEYLFWHMKAENNEWQILHGNSKNRRDDLKIYSEAS